MSFKLKVPKLDWRGKTLKLRAIVLCAPFVEIDPKLLDAFDITRRYTRGEFSEGNEPILPTISIPPTFLWEHYSDVKGREETVYGWSIHATLYAADGKPWWLVRAANKSHEPTERSIVELERIIDCLGGDVKRDCFMDCSFGEGRGYSMWWTWINQFELLEMQFRKDPFDMRVVPEGSPIPSGYTRIDRQGLMKPEHPMSDV